MLTLMVAGKPKMPEGSAVGRSLSVVNFGSKITIASSGNSNETKDAEDSHRSSSF